MKSAAATVELRLLPLDMRGTLRMCRVAGMLSGRQMARCANNRVLQHHWKPIVSLICSRVDASAASIAADNVGTKATRFQQLQDVIIVGGGISGLATALALHRLGIKPLLLEQADQLRTAGSTIGISTNAWKALEALGVADCLREKFEKLTGFEFFGEDGNLILSLGFDEVSRDVEMRGVERKALLETLRDPLPDGTVLYDSQVIGIRKLDGGHTEVQCENGQMFQTKVLIGCDGVRSVVAKWMNMEEPKYAGYAGTRGLAVYPDGHGLNNKVKQILGRGVRAGIVPMDANRVYWFVSFNSSGERVTDVELVRKEALNYVKGWPSMVTEAINRSLPETLSRRTISDRWMWPVGGPPLYKSGVTLVGDAMHPMTPNLGQGGCLALEDAVILARGLSKALLSNDSQQLIGSLDSQKKEMGRIELALKSYTEERRPRVLPLAIRSYLTGALLQLDSELMCSLRNKLLKKVMKVDKLIDHTFYDCGTLQ